MICPNCQTEYIGNFCPSCGQSAKTQRFTVKNAMMSTLEVWGMGNRSLPRTLIHLFTRPGYMIGEYLDGKRIPFFPPVKMLFVLCIFFALATTLVDGEHPKNTAEKETAKELKQEKIVIGKSSPEDKILFNINGNEVKIEDFINGIKAAAEWLEAHKAIELLCLHCFFMFFAWRVFRKSPIRPKSTLAENFFSQVYISGQMTAASIVYVLIFGNTKSTFYPLPWWALFGLFVWDFKQLFGYKWKTTIWRTILIHFYSFTTFVFICTLVIAILGIITGIFEEIANQQGILQ